MAVLLGLLKVRLRFLVVAFGFGLRFLPGLRLCFGSSLMQHDLGRAAPRHVPVPGGVLLLLLLCVWWGRHVGRVPAAAAAASSPVFCVLACVAPCLHGNLACILHLACMARWRRSGWSCGGWECCRARRSR